MIDDPDLARANVGEALAGLESRLLVGRQIREVRLRHVDRERSVGLGQAVDMIDLEVQLRHASDQRWRGRRPRREETHRPLEPVRSGVVRQGDQDGGRGTEVGNALIEQPPGGCRVDSGEADTPGADGGQRPGESPSVAVKHRQHPQVGTARSQSVIERHREGVQVRAPMVVDHALRPSRRPRCVVDRDRIVLVRKP